MQGVTFEGGFVLHLTSLIHSSTQKCKNLSLSRNKGGRRVAAAVWPPTAEYGHGGRIRPLLATLRMTRCHCSAPWHRTTMSGLQQQLPHYLT
jgi:hypothetical protein